jgi:hypothetical protein
MAESVYGVCNPPGRLSAASLQGGCVVLRASRLPAPEGAGRDDRKRIAFATALSARSVPLCLVRPASFPGLFRGASGRASAAAAL